MQLHFIFESLAAHELLAKITGFPAYLGALVPADVNVRRGEKRHHFSEHIFQKYKGLFFGAEDIFKNPPLSSGLKRPRCTGQLRVGCNSCLCMPRHFDFGYYRHVALSSITYNFAHFLLGVKPTVALAVIALRFVVVVADERLSAPGGYFCKLGILLNLNTPTLVIGKVPVKVILLVHRQHIDVLLNGGYIKKMPRHIQVHAAPRKAGRILYADLGHPPMIWFAGLGIVNSCRQ